ncbi:hypothetical protein QPK24_04055 [Paenibacillus polygoni]|uniref:MAPEG family protein n=1 Tax=Paenibacillus polygoni TaxID=3050112 RepID=A0ABY8X602_9BACL|nr:hypothetical protein [Paenibacillus polygoni]WIV19921.1 hypothetical protein QPK24_04055 [Paenibacillus polygoni]
MVKWYPEVIHILNPDKKKRNPKFVIAEAVVTALALILLIISLVNSGISLGWFFLSMSVVYAIRYWELRSWIQVLSMVILALGAVSLFMLGQ